ncbi:MAG: DNA-directed RNA polymerase [Candidatus Marsarchaeota archaeon]|jgi:DNA-directed RNA polymerase subunit E'|nr:DNA-directed RNA polymerase [Candidatus Marsarchaeota archaeon]
MYEIYTIKDMFKLPPDAFDKDLEVVAAQILQRKYEGYIDREMGAILAIFNVRNVSDGMIYPGDPATHHEAEFDVLTFMPKVDEVVRGEVTELAEFGAFVRIGMMDGLVHVSQIAPDFLSFDKKVPAFVSRKTGRNVKKGDVVYAKISTVSMKTSIKDSKIALTMKQEGLGKLEWLPSGSRQPQKAAQRKEK